MLTDLVQIRRLGEQKRGENERLRQYLKRHNFHERKMRKLAQEVEDAIDCRTCANCCRVATAKITERDVEKLAKYLRIKPQRFLADYAVETEDEGWVLRRTEQGCVFLDGNECTVYKARPATCEDFPHLIRGAGSFLARLWKMPDRATYCPIVYNAMEAFKVEVDLK